MTSAESLGGIAAFVGCIAVIVGLYTVTLRIKHRQTMRHGTSKPQSNEEQDTFVTANDGGWGDAPDVISLDPETDLGTYVASQLERAAQQAARDNIPIYGTFEYRLVNIPKGTHPTSCYGHLLFTATQYGLMTGSMRDEYVTFTRLE